ncbi:MAG: hypothetical protein IPN34_22995 [Planctomycetes bacterium]|nr:hypothetical protein [Planctomycetota bacterium]
MFTPSPLRFLRRLGCAALAAAGVLHATADAQIQPRYFGTGSRYQQQGGAISRNSTATPSGGLVLSAGSSLRRIYIRFLADTGRNVTGYDLWMRSNIGSTVLRASLWSATSGDAPGTELATGHLGLMTRFEWHRASFQQRHRISGAQLYFLAFDLPAGTAVEMGRSSSGGAASVAYFTSRTGAVNFAPLMYKVNADGEIPEITTQTAFRGQWAPLTCSGLQPNAYSILFLGLSDTVGLGGALPQLMGPPFVRGALQWISYEGLAWPVLADASGVARTALGYSANAPEGFRFFAQWVAETAPGSNHFVASNAADVVIN